MSLNALFDVIESVTGKALLRSHDMARRVDAPHIVMSSGRAARDYGWHARIELHEGLKRTWQWFNTIPR